MVGFMFWMLLASGLGFVKLLALAWALNASDFGHYVGLFGLSTLAGAMVSFGLVERTIKLYPRQWTQGQQLDILRNANQILMQLLVRSAAAGGLVVVAVTVTSVPVALGEVLSVTLLGLGTAWLALFASIYRAAGSRPALQRFALWRGGLACALALLGGLVWGWAGALFGDVLAAGLSSIYSLVELRRLCQAAATSHAEMGGAPAADKSSAGHRDLYAANLLSASTGMVDKAWVGGALNPAAAGTYGVVMLLPQIAQMLVNVVAQYVGPLVIKFVHVKHVDRSRISALGLQGALLALAVTAGVAIALVSKRLPLLQPLFDKFAISDLALVLAGIAAAAQIYTLIEFHLIAHDCERRVLLASLVSSAVFFGLFAATSHWQWGIELYVGAAAVTRWLQVTILAHGISTIKSRQP